MGFESLSPSQYQEAREQWRSRASWFSGLHGVAGLLAQGRLWPGSVLKVEREQPRQDLLAGEVARPAVGVEQLLQRDIQEIATARGRIEDSDRGDLAGEAGEQGAQLSVEAGRDAPSGSASRRLRSRLDSFLGGRLQPAGPSEPLGPRACRGTLRRVETRCMASVRL